MQIHNQSDTTDQQTDNALTYTISSKCSGGSCVGVARLEDGTVMVRNTTSDSNQPIAFTRDEWVAFIAGVKNDEFNI